MYNRIVGVVLSLLLLCLLAGCAATHYSQGQSALKQGDLDSAIESLKLALDENPENPKVIRDLGIAYYRKLNMDLSIELLSKSLQIEPQDGLTLFYLGTAHEILGHYPQAIDTYRRYSQVSRMTHVRKSIEGRLEKLINKQIVEETKAVVAQEEAIDIAAIPNNTVAAVYFMNMGNNRELDPLQKGIADMLITDLSKSGELTVVERIRMQKLMEEIGLGMTGLVNATTAPRVGKLLGAAVIVNGAFIDLEGENLRIDAGVIETKTNKVSQSEPATGALNDFFRIEKDLVFNILDHMGIQPTQEERDAILVIPTENLLAFLAYCKGLDYEDRGMFEEAKAQYQLAVSIDPDFSAAQGKVERAEVHTEPEVEIAQLETEVAAEIEAPAPAPIEAAIPTMGITSESSTAGRLVSSGENVGAGFIPGVESRKPAEESSGGTALGSAVIKIEIPLPQQRP